MANFMTRQNMRPCPGTAQGTAARTHTPHTVHVQARVWVWQEEVGWDGELLAAAVITS